MGGTHTGQRSRLTLGLDGGGTREALNRVYASSCTDAQVPESESTEEGFS